MEHRKSLLERFGIPINHLDFEYVKKCENAREMEKIVHILRSGEEGYFPDLTTCAEERLRLLKPESRLFRFEEPLGNPGSISKKEWHQIYNWADEIKSQDIKLAEFYSNESSNADYIFDLPPMRKTGRIADNGNQQINATNKVASATPNTGGIKNNATRIKSTDYKRWDKFDADEEMLRMDLTEERVKEEVERKNRINLQKCEMITKQKTKPYEKMHDLSTLQKLTDIERDKLAEKYRLRGNDFYRTKEYEAALVEYSRAISMRPEGAAACYNNRAVTLIKLQKYLEAIDDCEHCLELEPLNVKARLRLAQATYFHGRRRESYALFEKVLELEPTNAIALNTMTKLRSELGEMPPAHATRLQIQEGSAKTSKTAAAAITAPSTAATATTTLKTTTAAKPTTESSATGKTYDLAELVKPNRIVKNKLASAAEAFGGLQSKSSKPSPPPPPPSPPPVIKTSLTEPEESEETLPQLQIGLNVAAERAKRCGRVLIEEL